MLHTRDATIFTDNAFKDPNKTNEHTHEKKQHTKPNRLVFTTSNNTRSHLKNIGWKKKKPVRTVIVLSTRKLSFTSFINHFYKIWQTSIGQHRACSVLFHCKRKSAIALATQKTTGSTIRWKRWWRKKSTDQRAKRMNSKNQMIA